MPLSQPKRVAVIGGGCAGVTSFWALQHSVHDVHLFEASSDLGGRIKTVPFKNGETRVDVNTESPCFNPEASPNFVSLLRSLGIPTSPIPLTFGASDGLDTYQWRCSVLENVLLRPWSLYSLETCRVLFDFIRLRYLVLDVLMDRCSFNPQHRSHQFLSVYDYLSNEGFSTSFRDKFLAPLLSTLWGTNAGRFLPRLSIRALAHFLHNHELLRVRKVSPPWRRMDVTANQLIQRMTDGFPSKVHLGTRVQQITRSGKRRYNLFMSNGQENDFDHVIFAVDSHEILRLLQSSVDSEEKENLQNIRTTRNIAVLHSDPPPISNAPCNYIISPNDNPNRHNHPPTACLTYNLKSLQNIPPTLAGPISLAINPFTPPHPSLVQAVWEFTDTEISTTTLHAHHRLRYIQNKNGLSYCTTWTGRGSFEDAVTGGLRVAVGHLGAEVPFDVELHGEVLDDEASGVGLVLGLRDHLVLTGLVLVRVYVKVFELLVLFLGLSWVWMVRKGRVWKRR